ncbi:MAG TPA: alkaline phosphatase family protein [Terracidiphilus sp.]|nr:alkaline phosphatase family protein [Terracidiphilus sp.]
MQLNRIRVFAGLALVAALSCSSARAQDQDRDNDMQIKHVFVIALENHNWTQPNNNIGQTTGIQQIYQNPNAPFINSLVNGTAKAYINGRLVNISKQVSYATAYHNVLASDDPNGPHIHPSEPQYLWAEAGTNFGILNDADPYPSNVQTTTQHLSALLQRAGKTWKSYQEDTDLTTLGNGNLTNLPLSQNQWTVPLVSLSGLFDAGSMLNEYSATLQYNYAPKHNPMVFFTDTNGNGDATTANPMRFHYAPMQQLAFDLANNAVADYNWITPDQYNEMHSRLSTPFDGLTGDVSQIRAGDNTVSRLVPMIMASQAYRDGGAIILWWDETENDGQPGGSGDDLNHTIGEIVISPLAHENVGGMPYASAVDYSHSSDLRTMQEIFHVRAQGGSSPYLGDAKNANDLSDLFQPGVIPTQP